MAKKTPNPSPKPATVEPDERPLPVRPLTRRGYKRLPEIERQIAEAAVLDARALLAHAEQRDEAEPRYLAPEAIGSLYPAVLAQPEMEKRRSPLVSIPPLGRGFSRHGGLSIRWRLGGARTSPHAPVHRLDEPTGISLGMVASPQCPLPFHPARSL
jgi:hypothetical protein